MDLKSIPHAPGVYLMRDGHGHILYVGKARDLAKRVGSYFMSGKDHTAKIAALVASIRSVDYVPSSSEREALIIEQGLIRRLQPHFNAMWKDDKSYPFVKITTREEYPRIFLTRKVVKDGSRYFGPFPNVGLIRRLLRYIWKQKMFPLRPCRFEFSEKNPLKLEIAKQCLYYHTKECPAPCVNRISKDDYRKIVKETEMFFRGNFKPLVASWGREMKEASAAQNYERAAQLRDNLAAVEHMNERVTVRQIDLSDISDRVDRSRAVTDLQTALALKRPPVRMECFDISHFQGTETVASMVSFDRGEPDKSNYRKFKIKTVRGIDDFASMAEVVGRRYRRLLREHKPLPDLILIDGGKGQLSAAVKSLAMAMTEGRREGNHQPTPAIASLAKREEELFLPAKESPVVLPKDSAALHLVQRVRDEAHRFAITFHRHRRAKALIHEAKI